MSTIEFSWENYEIDRTLGNIGIPLIVRPYIQIDTRKYVEMENSYEDTITLAMKKIEKRLSYDYWKQVKFAYFYNNFLDDLLFRFPAFNFIFPEVIADDWITMVGWHQNFCRDHILHQPLTSYVVLKLLNDKQFIFTSQLGEQKNLLEHIADILILQLRNGYLGEYLRGFGLFSDESWDKIIADDQYSRALWLSKIKQTAYIASVFHDMGYPWQYVSALYDKLDHINKGDSRPRPSASSILEFYIKKLFLFPLNGYEILRNTTPVSWSIELQKLIEKSNTDTHGFPGAIAFTYLNDAIRKYPDNLTISRILDLFCIDWAAMAIMMHDMINIYWDKSHNSPDNPQLRIDFSVDPLSAVITLADIIEDFQRPNVFFEQLGISEIEYNKLQYSNACSKVKVSWDEIRRVLSIDFEMTNLASHRAKKRYFIDNGEFQRIFNRSNGYLDLSYLGINEINSRVYQMPRI